MSHEPLGQSFYLVPHGTISQKLSAESERKRLRLELPAVRASAVSEICGLKERGNASF